MTLILLSLGTLASIGCRDHSPMADSGAEVSTIADAAESVSPDATATISESITSVIMPGPEAQAQAQEALITAEPGDVIEFAAGTFEFVGTLSLDGIAGITIRGQGIDDTILNFTGQRKGSGGEGLMVKADRFTIEDLTIQNTPGDAIKISDSNEVTIRRIRTWWSEGPSEQNGAYGIYPVMCSNVLIEHCVAECASDAGIYVGQTRQTIVRHNRAMRNVAGIEIENTIGADVYENEATNNTGGILVFSLPGLQLKNGSHTRVFKNRLFDNNHPNFAHEGAMVATVPAGTGLMIMANDHVEVFENDIHGNKTANCAVVSFLATQRKFDDPQYDPYPEAIHIHDNRMSDGGKDPQGVFGDIYKQAGKLPMPDIVVDGVLDPAKLVDGKLPDTLAWGIVNNGDATFVNLGLAAMLQGKGAEISDDSGDYAAARDPLAAIVLSGVE
ncbi:parallel beta-helix domain-containing protein [Rosistilla ulvae]|uniref:parallel beta-helix domain-containing protein n=1 Tax=Rosistilla ulvae TaxID=1930277 RepID=UPI001C54E6D6|nr:parallel beta-helix domain-containing protein [Rosistilla ulvae]